jgi:ribonucleoside-diphosphate reductase alpha chain
LGKKWKDNCEEERLLGVSLTGIMDHPVLSTVTDTLPNILEELRDHAIKINAKWAKQFGIAPSAAITCVKPSGTVSQLTSSSSGIHPRYAPYYLRRVRQHKTDPISQVLIDAGVPHETDVTNETQWVFTFPIKSPDACVTVDGITAIEQLEHWKLFNEVYCEHKPSVSIYVRDSEWMEVGAWVYNNFDHLSGVSFFPVDDHSYRQAPYERIEQQEYEAMARGFPTAINWDIEEEMDSTTSSQELACAGGACEL